MSEIEDYAGVESEGNSKNAYVVLTGEMGFPAACGIFRTRAEADEWIASRDGNASDRLHVQATPLITPDD
jgi:hypothetical protein